MTFIDYGETKSALYQNEQLYTYRDLMYDLLCDAHIASHRTFYILNYIGNTEKNDNVPV